MRLFCIRFRMLALNGRSSNTMAARRIKSAWGCEPPWPWESIVLFSDHAWTFTAQELTQLWRVVWVCHWSSDQQGTLAQRHTYHVIRGHAATFKVQGLEP